LFHLSRPGSKVISSGEIGILYHERVHHSRTRLIQDAEKLFWPIKLRQFVICGTAGEQSSRMLKLVCFVYLVHLVCLVEPNKRDKPNKPNNSLLLLADFFSILLKVSAGTRKGIHEFDRKHLSIESI
jgi:hypothetical protein